MPRSTASSATPRSCSARELSLASSRRRRRRVRVNDIMSVRETAGHLIDGMTARARAFVRCRTAATTAAPSASSRTAAAIRARCRWARSSSRSAGCVDNGYREVVLTGVDITSYGADLPGDADARQAGARDPEARAGAGAAAAVLDRLDRGRRRAARGDRRGGAADAASASVAAGRRRHDPEAHEAAALARRCASRFCETVRRLRPDIVFGADLIAGFPTETRGDVRATRCAIVEDCGLTYLHVFPFSPRPGTPAARMPQVDRALGQGARRTAARRGRAALAALSRRREQGAVAACWSSATASAAPSISPRASSPRGTARRDRRRAHHRHDRPRR